MHYDLNWKEHNIELWSFYKSLEQNDIDIRYRKVNIQIFLHMFILFSPLWQYHVCIYIFVVLSFWKKNITVFVFVIDSHSFSYNDHKSFSSPIHVSSMLLELFMSNWFPPGHLTSCCFLWRHWVRLGVGNPASGRRLSSFKLSTIHITYSYTLPRPFPSTYVHTCNIY